MFKCPISRTSSRPGEKPVKVVLETRPRVYYKRVKSKEKDADGLPIWLDIKIGEGFEIVKEIMVRQEALEKLKNV